MESIACLYIEKGEPYGVGSCILLEEEETVIGRVSQQGLPDIAFLNAFVSRRHVLIRREQGRAVLYDLGSKHGTEVNETPLSPHVPYPLRHMDRIHLAGGMIVLRFSHSVTEQTLELDASELQQRLKRLAKPFLIDRDKRVCTIDGQVVNMTEKEWRLFLMLHDQPGALMTNDEIKRTVWPERALDGDGVPDVGNEELSSLVYRLRKKLQPGNLQIRTIRGTGYLLEQMTD